MGTRSRLRRTGGTRATAPARARLPEKAGKPERVPPRADKPISSAPFEHEVEKLAGQIAGDTEDQITIELARVAAEAELELARVWRLKVAWPHSSWLIRNRPFSSDAKSPQTVQDADRQRALQRPERRRRNARALTASLRIQVNPIQRWRNRYRHCKPCPASPAVQA
jgi:hypothetical protein